MCAQKESLSCWKNRADDEEALGVELASGLDGELRQMTLAKMREAVVPGCAVAVLRNDEVVWSEGFGFANLDHGAPARPDTLFRIGSNTKMLTATAVMILRDAGRLDLDDPVVKYLPEFRPRGRHGERAGDVRIRHLLSHTSGLQREAPGDYWNTLVFPGIRAILESLPDAELTFRAGEKFAYSNLGYGLLGEIVARAADRPYEAYVQERILGPLGMDSTAFRPAGPIRERVAVGYQPRPYQEAVAPSDEPDIGGVASAGQLYSTVLDLLRFGALQWRDDDGGVLAAESREEMRRLRIMVAPDWSAGYGMGWFLRRSAGDRILAGHGGGIHGFISEFLVATDLRLGVAVFTNSGHGSPVAALAPAMLEKVAGVRIAPLDEPYRAPLAASAAMEAYLGTYTFATGDWTVRYRDGRLHLAPLQAGSAMPMPLVEGSAADRFVIASGPEEQTPVTFERGSDGAIVALRMGGYRMRRI